MPEIGNLPLPGLDEAAQLDQPRRPTEDRSSVRRQTPMRSIESAYAPRPYQEQSCDAVLETFRVHRSALVVLPTGTGKTLIFCLLAKLGIIHARRVLILVDRDELVQQAVDRLLKDVFMEAAVEKGRKHAPKDSALVVASVQSLHEERLHTWDREAFDLIVIDESHHAVAPSYVRILEHFKNAKFVGVTATPDRSDARNLMNLFDDVAFEMTMRDAVNEGWLVPPVQKRVPVDGLDYSDIRRVAGELSADDLDSVLRNEDVLEKMVVPTIERVEDRQSIVFCATIAHAHAVAERFRALGRTAMAVDQSTPKKKRRELIKAFRDGDIQFAVNVGIFTEGFDAPIASSVVVMRPIMSRSLYAQICGRGARPYPTDFINSLTTAALRKAAIAESSKPNFQILDFAGNAGKHSLVHPVSALDPSADPEIHEKAEQLLAENPNMTLFDALEEAERARDALVSRMREREGPSKVWSNAVDIDPFMETPAGETLALFDLPRLPDYWERKPTEGQVKALKNFGVENADDLTRSEAKALLDRLVPAAQQRRATVRQMQALVRNGVERQKVLTMSFDDARDALDARPVSEGQSRVLRRFGYKPEEISSMNSREASSRIDAIKENGWRRPESNPPTEAIT